VGRDFRAALGGRVDRGISYAGLFAPAAWHVHEMMFGFIAAAVGGFVLTAIPNWTGRLPVRGSPEGLRCG
jgi:uncharacterized protein involved in response to NO